MIQFLVQTRVFSSCSIGHRNSSISTSSKESSNLTVPEPVKSKFLPHLHGTANFYLTCTEQQIPPSPARNCKFLPHLHGTANSSLTCTEQQIPPSPCRQECSLTIQWGVMFPLTIQRGALCLPTFHTVGALCRPFTIQRGASFCLLTYSGVRHIAHYHTVKCVVLTLTIEWGALCCPLPYSGVRRVAPYHTMGCVMLPVRADSLADHSSQAAIAGPTDFIESLKCAKC